MVFAPFALVPLGELIVDSRLRQTVIVGARVVEIHVIRRLQILAQNQPMPTIEPRAGVLPDLLQRAGSEANQLATAADGPVATRFTVRSQRGASQAPTIAPATGPEPHEYPVISPPPEQVRCSRGSPRATRPVQLGRRLARCWTRS